MVWSACGSAFRAAVLPQVSTRWLLQAGDRGRSAGSGPFVHSLPPAWPAGSRERDNVSFVPSKLPEVDVLLTAAVAGIGGAQRPGQGAMAEAGRPAIETGEQLALDARARAGHSPAYPVPAPQDPPAR